MSDRYLYKIGDGAFCEMSTRPLPIDKAIELAVNRIKARGLNRIDVTMEIIDYDTGDVVRKYEKN